MNEREGFGPALRAIRAELGLTQEAVAHALRTTQRHLSFLETGRSAPTREMLGRIVAGTSKKEIKALLDMAMAAA